MRLCVYRFISMFLVLCFFVGLIPESFVVAANESNEALVEEFAYFDGEGTESSPYLIKTEADLSRLALLGQSKTVDGYFKLQNDIVVTAEVWIPICQNNTFAGFFDGNGHIISGIKSFSTELSNQYAGVFGKNSGTIQNLGVQFTATTENVYTGAIVGSNSGNIIDCFSKGKLVDYYSSRTYIGGVVGQNTSTGIVNRCISSVSIVIGDEISPRYATYGGLVGQNIGTVSFSLASGNISGKLYHADAGNAGGGLIGANYDPGVVTDCFATGNVEGFGYAGGLIGLCDCEKDSSYSDIQTTIQRCFASGFVSGNWAGGLVGYNLGFTVKDYSISTALIEDCFACGAVNGLLKTGGLVGWNRRLNWGSGNTYNAIIRRCYAYGNVSGSNCGGLVGLGSDQGIVESSYYNATLSGCSDTDRGAPLSSEEMRNPDTYSAWDFSNTWEFYPSKNCGYPVLRSLLTYENDYEGNSILLYKDGASTVSLTQPSTPNSNWGPVVSAQFLDDGILLSQDNANSLWVLCGVASQERISTYGYTKLRITYEVLTPMIAHHYNNNSTVNSGGIVELSSAVGFCNHHNGSTIAFQGFPIDEVGQFTCEMDISQFTSNYYFTVLLYTGYGDGYRYDQFATVKIKEILLCNDDNSSCNLTNGNSNALSNSGESGAVNWKYESGTLTVYGTGSMADYDTPDHLPWIDFASQIETVIIESGVTNIGKWAFGRCSNMNRIIIPKSVTSIGEAAFAGCSSLTSVSIPEGVTSIGDLAFLMCSGLAEVKLSNDRAFYELNDLTNVLYQGNSSQWSQITIGYNNDPLSNVLYGTYDGNPEYVQSLPFCADISFKWSGDPINACYSDSIFYSSSYEYNHELAWMSLGLEVSSFSVDEDLYYGEDKYAVDNVGKNIDVEEQRTANIRQAYADMGFDETTLFFSKYDVSLNDTSDRAAFSFARKILSNGETLVTVVLRGGGYGCEWSSNFHVEDGWLYHRAFKDCANDAFIALKDYIKNIDGGIKFWITGYSRAGATANLLTAMLDDYSDSDVRFSPDSIFCYTFATPQGVTENVENVHDSKYNNIFNIVNPCDFVPQVAFTTWGFTRYGVTKVFDVPLGWNEQGLHNQKIISTESALISLLMEGYPSCSSSTAIQKVISGLLEYLFSKKYVKNSGNQGTWENIVLNDYADEMRCKYGNEWDTAYVSASCFLSMTSDGNLILNAVQNNESTKDLIILLFSLCELYGINSPNIASLIIDIVTSNILDTIIAVNGISQVGNEHLPSTYFDYLMVDEDRAFLEDGLWETIGRIWKYAFHCPVDIQVYDSRNELVADVKDHRIVYAEIPVIIRGESTEFFFIASPENYRIEVLPTDVGTMSYSVTELDRTMVVERRINYTDLAISPSQIFDVDVNLSEEYFDGMFDLIQTENGVTQQIIADEVLTDNYSVLIDVDIIGNGSVIGNGNYIRGDTIILHANPENEYVFDGWFENGDLISYEKTIRLELLEDRNLQAIFRNNSDDHVWSEPIFSSIPGSKTTVAKIWSCEQCGEVHSEIVPCFIISFESSGGIGTMDSVTVISEEEYTLPECDFIAREGKRFKSWLIGETEYFPGDKYYLTENSIIKAVWEDIPFEICIITYDSNGGSGTMEESTTTQGQVFILPDSSFLAPSGQRFKAWLIGEAEYDPSSGYIFTENTVVKAVWEDLPQYTVIWLNSDGSQLDSKTYYEGQTEPTTDKTPTKADTASATFTFKSWKLKSTSGNVKTYEPEFTETAKD